MDKVTLEFLLDFETGKPMSFPLGRLYLLHGHCVRMYFTPAGFQLLIPQDVLDDGTIMVEPHRPNFNPFVAEEK